MSKLEKAKRPKAREEGAAMPRAREEGAAMLRAREEGAAMPRAREEGAAMLIVMTTLLTVTATAIFAIHATAYEVRSSGYIRQAHQTQYVSESGAMGALGWVEFNGPAAMLELERRSDLNPTGALNLMPFEPELAPAGELSGSGRFAMRLYVNDLTLVPGQPAIDQDSVGGTTMAYSPLVLVDITDTRVRTAVTDGARADGRGAISYLDMTMTSRGRTMVTEGDLTLGSAQEYRTFHEGASDTRVMASSGPFFATGPVVVE